MKYRVSRGVPSLLLATLMWGSTFPLIKLLTHNLTPLAYVSYRSMIASLPLLPFIILIRPSFRLLTAGFSLGLLYFLGLYIQAIGITYTTSSNAAFITSFSVPLVYLLEVIFLKRKPSAYLTLSVVTATLGILLLSLNPNRSPGSTLGDVITLLSTVIWAVQVILVDIYSKKYKTLPLTALELVSSGAVGVTTYYVLPSLHNEVNVSLPTLQILIYLSLVGSVIACTLQVYGQRSTSSTQAAIIYTLEPVFATLFASKILGENLHGQQYLGATLILISLYMASINRRT